MILHHDTRTEPKNYCRIPYRLPKFQKKKLIKNIIAIISSTPTFLLSIQVPFIPFIPSRAPEARSNLSTRRTAKRGKKERNEKKERKKKEKNTVFVSFFHPESIPYHGVSYNTNFIQYLCEQTTRVQCHDTGNIIIITGSFHNVLASIHPSHPSTHPSAWSL